MSASIGLLLRGMRWRLGATVLTVITSAIAVGAAVLGPLYLNTAGDSAVRSAVLSAPVEARGVTLSALPGQQVVLPQVQRAEEVVERALRSRRWYGQPITTILSGVGLVGPGASPLRSQLLSRTGICGVLRFREGSCGLPRGDVAVSDRSARELGVSLGSVIDAHVGASSVLRLKVTGIYEAPNPDLPYWWGNGSGYFAFGQATAGPQRIPEVDSLIASPATTLAVPVQEVPEVMGQIPLRAGTVGLGDEGALRGALSAATAAVRVRGIMLSTALPSLLDGAGHERHVMATIVVVAAAELVLLALWVLGSLLVRTSDARRSEIRVARLRGFPAVTMLWATAAEPALLCLVGILIGIGLAWGVVVIARDRLLNPAATISPDVWVFAALALSVLAIGGALTVGIVRLVRSSSLSEARAPAASLGGRISLVADVVLLVLSLVALLALSTSGALSGRSDPLASAAPGLIALGAAVIAVQVVLFVCRLGVSASAYSRRVAAFLALRQVVRRPGVLRHARVLIIALGLACFATTAWAVARRNRRAVATFSVGTATVATVSPQGPTLERAVDSVDPRGRFAMAAVAVATSSSTLLAVDASRLQAVASWPRGISRSSLAAISRKLTPSTVPEVSLPDAPVLLKAATTARGAAAGGLGELDLGLWVFNPLVGTTIVSLGRLHAGVRSYQASLADVCPGGCRLVGVGAVPAPNNQGPASGAIDLRVSGVFIRTPTGQFVPVAADLFAGGWRPTAGNVQVEASQRALTFVIPASAAAADVGAVGAATSPMVSIADAPQALPAVATSEVESLNGASSSEGSIPAQGIDGNTVYVTPVATASALPRVGGNAVMVDLDLLSRLQTAPTYADATDQVWLGPAAPTNALARLQAAGLRVDGVQRFSSVLAQAQRSGPALADDFLLVATVAALLAAAASTLGAVGTTTRQRATELAAFEVAGVSRRTLAGSLAVEAAVLALTTVAGTAAGILAAVMAVPSLPELSGAPLIPLQYGVPAGPVAAVSGAVLATILLSCAAVAAVLITRTSPSLLRTAPDETVA